MFVHSFAHAKEKNQQERYILGIHKYEDKHLKLKESIALESKIGHLLDSIYVLTREAIKTFDVDCEVKFTR